MSDWHEDVGLARALWCALETYQVPFVEIPPVTASIAPPSEVDKLYFARTALLSQDTDQVINFYNRAAEGILGYSPEEAIGMPSAELAPVRLRGHRDAAFKGILEGMLMKEVTTMRLTKSGEEIPLFARVFPYELAPGVMSIAATIQRVS